MHTKKLKKLKIISLVVTIAVMSNIFGIQSVFAADQTINTAVSAGSTLAIVVPGGTINLSTVTASATSTGTSTGGINGIEIVDARGTGAGWQVSSTATNLGLAAISLNGLKTPPPGMTAMINGAYNGLNPTPTFSGGGSSSSGQFVIMVDAVSSGIPTQVDIVKPNAAGNLSDQATGVQSGSSTILVDGMTIVFDGNWSAGGSLKINTDHFPYTALLAIPSNFSSPNGDSLAGITVSDFGLYTGGNGVVSDPRIEITAPTNTGMGAYGFTLGLNQVTHKFPLVGTYTSTITLSII